MIKLKLSFGKNESESDFEIESGELLKAAIERATKEIPLGEFKLQDVFNVVVNGHIIEHDFWSKISLKQEDNILITPKLKDGDFGQVFKQVLIIAVAIAASVVFPPASFGALGSGLIVAGITIGATLALNALIPPPAADLNGQFGLDGSVESSQMYAITGQSNQMKRLGMVPKVYGSHRMFPTLAANPYTELAVNPANGEIVQYLCGVYDFGLGTPQLSDIKIGDTPITSDSFEDFQYRLVDPNRPDIGQDEFDTPLNKEFQLYKGDRSTAPLSFALLDSTEIIQNSANNPKSLQQEILLDFICPRGLFGYSSGGQLGSRSIRLEIDFAPVASSDWKPYNDLSAVDSFDIVGGTEITSFTYYFEALLPSNPLFSTYYESSGVPTGNYNGATNFDLYVRLKANTNKILVTPTQGDDQWQVGHGIFLDAFFAGTIQSIAMVSGLIELTLDQPIPAGTPAYIWKANITYSVGGPPPVPVYEPAPWSTYSVKSSFSDPSAATITSDKTSAIYASFKFRPKAIGQFQVRVRRVSTVGNFTQQTADDVTWAGITTAYNNTPILTTKRHVFLEIRVRATNQLNGNIQNLSAVATQILDIYDPNTLTWSRGVTNNPAWVFVDLLTGEVNKKFVSKSRLHIDSIVEWADYCAEIPTPPLGNTYLWPRFSCNFVLDYETTLQGVLQQIGGAAQASLNIIDGKYGVLVDRLKTTPVQIFTPRNSRDFSSTRFYSTRPHAVKVKYIDPQLGWEVSEVIAYDNGYDEDTAIDIDEMTSFACTSQEQAWRFGRYMIAQNKLRQETMSIFVDFENLICTRGDYVQISQDVMRVGGRPARVKNVSGITITIDDSLDIDPLLTYGYTFRSVTGEIITSTLTPLSANTFAIDGATIIFPGDTTGQDFDAYYRFGGLPAIIGASKKVVSLVGVFALGDTTYTLPDFPISEDELVVWINGMLRTDYNFSGDQVVFVGQDTTGQDFDAQYRHNNATISGDSKRINALTGVFSAGDTVYTLPEPPLSNDDLVVWLDGIERTDYTLLVDQITFPALDTTGQVCDVKYRNSGSVSLIGTARKIVALVGTFAAGETTYLLPESPISEDDLIISLNGIMRTDYGFGGNIPAVGDLIVIGEVGKIVFDCIVKSISPNDDLSASITLVERANDIFSYESESVLPDYDPQISQTSNPDFRPPRAVVGLTVTELNYECAETQSGYNYFVLVSWDIPPGSVYEYFEIWLDDGRGYHLASNTNAKYYKRDIDQARLGYPHGIKVVAVAASGKKLQLIEMPEVLFTPVVKDVPPSDVGNFGMSITNQTLQLTWDAVPDCDINKYEIRYSPDVNDVWEASTPLQLVDRNVNSVVVQARTGVYFIKAIDFAGNKSVNVSRAITTIPDLFDLNIIQTFNDAPGFVGEMELTELLGSAVVLKIKTVGDVDTMEFFPEGFYNVFDLLDLGDIYSVRLASYIRADGYRFGELLSSWDHLSDIDHLSISSGEDWNVIAEYRATNEILAMSDWLQLADIEHINEGIGAGFTDWRPIPTIGDATGRVFQFRIRLESLTPNVTPRLFDASLKADMPDRIDSFENLVSSATDPFTVTYEKTFRGPTPSPNVQISIDNGQAGDYWVFDNKSLEGFDIRFYDISDAQVSRQFDVQAKGFGSRHTVTI